MAEHKKLRASFEEISNQVSQIGNGLNQVAQMLNGLRQGLAQQGEALSALIALFGEKLVQEQIEAVRKERQEQNEKQQVESLKVLTDAKVLVPVDVVAADSFIVGQDTFKDGRTQRVQFEVSTTGPEDQVRYIGKKVGDTLENAEKTVVFSIVAIYAIDKVAAEAYAAEQQKKALQAQAAAIPEAPPVTVEVSAVSGNPKLSTADGVRDDSGTPNTDQPTE